MSLAKSPHLARMKKRTSRMLRMTGFGGGPRRVLLQSTLSLPVDSVCSGGWTDHAPISICGSDNQRAKPRQPWRGV